MTLGAYLVVKAPFASGTDESINYVAFAAAKNRWAVEEDFRRDGISFYYYPPLYFLLFAPFYGDDPAFVEDFPREAVAPPLSLEAGGTRVVADDVADHVAPSLDALYRRAKVLSLLLGLGTALLVGLTAASLVTPEERGWAFVLAGGSLLLVPQFLYYATLVNNDVLVNFWCALGGLLFVRQMIASRDGRTAEAARWLGALGACAGLAVFTKTSGVVLLILMAVAAIHAAWRPNILRNRQTALSWFAGSGAAALAFLAAGGWWIVRGFLTGDPTGMKAIRTAHAWALLPEPFWQTFGIVPFVLMIWRTYFGLFNAATWSLPDGMALTYILFSIAWLAVGLAGLCRTRMRDHRWVIVGLVLMGLGNTVLLVAYNQNVRAPYGRLLFPSLVLWHGAMAAGIASFTWSRRPLTIAAVTVLLSVLFASAYMTRIVPATVQSPELMVPLARFRDFSTFNAPAWQTPLVQPLRLQPGKLVAFRTPLLRTGWPMLGGKVSGRLVIPTRNGEPQVIDLIDFIIADNDGQGVTRWAELRLPRPIDILGEPMVELHLSCRAPWSPPGGDVKWAIVPQRDGQLAAGLRLPDGTALDRSLALSAAYLPSAS